MTVEQVTTQAGTFAYVDFGGQGRDVLLTHNLGLNLEAVRPLGEALARTHHVVAVDSGGHGATLAPAVNPVDEGTRFGPLLQALGLQRPVLYGEGSSAWAVVTAMAAETVESCGAVLVMAAPFMRPEGEAFDHVSQLTDPTIIRWLNERFDHGRVIDERDLADVIGADVESRKGDWLFEGVPPASWARLVDHAYQPVSGGKRQRLPQPDDVVLGAGINPDWVPCAETFARIDEPMLFIDPTQMLTDDDHQALDRVVAQAPGRRRLSVDGAQFMAMSHPEQLAEAIRQMWP